MSEAKLLRALADRIDELEAAKLFPAEIGDPGDLTVTWSAGNDHEGYKVLSEAISELVKQHWGALRTQVIKQREASVSAARLEWSTAHPPGKDTERPTARPSPELGLRKAG
jgi:hypothetical protein